MPMKGVHAVPMLSPVVEDFVPPPFRGNVPDTPRAETAATSPGAPPAKSEAVASGVDARADTGFRSRVVLMLLNWRKRAERTPVQVATKKPVQVHGLPRQKSTKYPRSRRSVGHYLNPLCVLAKLRDYYIHMMNNVATSGIVPGGPMGDDSGTHASTLFFSREFDTDSIAQLVELERNGSKPDTDQYRQNLTFARNVAKVNAKLCGEDLLSIKIPGGDLGGREPALSRVSYSSKSSSDSTVGRRLSREPVLSRSKSNSLSDDIFFSRKLKGSRKKLHINPYMDTDWTADMVSNVAKVETKVAPKARPNDFHFQRERTLPGTEIRLQQEVSEGTLFAYRR